MRRFRRVALVLLLFASCAGDPQPAAPVAAVGEACKSPSDPNGPACDRTAAPAVVCLYSEGESFCAPGCQTAGDDAACQSWFPGGCCTQAGDGANQCVPQRFCEQPKKAPGETCVGEVECTDAFGEPVCVRIGNEDGICSFECRRHAECQGVYPNGCCVDTATELGIICFSEEDSERLGIQLPCGP